MTESTRVTTTSIDGAKAVSVGGRTAMDAAAELMSLVRSKLGRSHAEVFSRPVFSVSGHTVDWYVNWPGDSVAASELDTGATNAAHATVNHTLTDIRNLADQLIERSDSTSSLGELLALIGAPPDPAQIFIVGGTPVIIG